MTTLGADIEFVAYRNNQPASIVNLIGGTKSHPLWLEDGNLQEDNVLAEMAITPVSSMAEWVRKIETVKHNLAARLSDFELRVLSSARFADTELNTPEAQTFGCEPDFCAWTLGENDPPDPSEVGNLRTCGGHIHVSFPEIEGDDLVNKALFIHWMDVFLGLPSLAIDFDQERRQVYGKAGSFRPKDYGVEYRALSNFWAADASLMQWAYRRTEMAIEAYRNSSPVHEQFDINLIQDTINNSDVVTARAVLNQLEAA